MKFDPSKFVLEIEKKESEFGRVKPGNYSARVVHVIDLGTKEKEGEDKTTKEKYSYETRQIFINFVLSAKVLTGDDGKESAEKKEVTIGKVYATSLSSNSKLYKDVKAGFGFEPQDKFNPFTLIGKAVMVNVGEHKSGDNTYSVIDALSTMPEEMPEYKNEMVLGASLLEEGLIDEELIEKYLYGFAKTDLETSKEYIALTGKQPNLDLEAQEREIEAEIAKTKEAQKTETNITPDEAESIFDSTDTMK